MGVLESVDGQTRHVLLPTTTVGRSPKSDLRLTDGDVSTHQAELKWTGDHWQLRDAGSKNGTMVDGRVLREGDVASLSAGAMVVFATEQAWTLVDAGPPGFPMAMPLAGGGPIQAVNGVLSLPPGGPEEVRITRDGAHFLAQSGDGPARVDDGEIVVAAGRSYRIRL
ncbi:MAG: FHA domain-containing protein, partial [Myxococcales bacterium]|nr:FHA domain-containing protein [Myxococcales bacterium]